MTIELVCIGKMKEAYSREAMAEYEKRLSRFCKFSVVELPDCSIPDKASPAEEQAVLEKEGLLILQKIKKGSYVTAMCVEAKPMTTEAFAAHMQKLALQGNSHLTFVIGGSLGLSQQVKDRSDEKMSLSAMTLTHNMARLFLTEQIYRTYKINAGETYHK